eukprot:277447-Amphidinium_carterae.1
MSSLLDESLILREITPFVVRERLHLACLIGIARAAMWQSHQGLRSLTTHPNLSTALRLCVATDMLRRLWYLQLDSHCTVTQETEDLAWRLVCRSLQCGPIRVRLRFDTLGSGVTP